MKKISKILFSSGFALIIFITSSIIVLGSGGGEVEPNTTSIVEKD